MALDLAQPRAIRPLVPPPDPPSSLSSGGSAPNKAGAAGSAPGEAAPAPRPRTAIHVRLTEDVLHELLDLARKAPAGVVDGAARLDLGEHPAFIVNGVRHALALHSEAPNTELVRVSSSSRDLDSIAAVTHRASVQHSKADLDKAGQRARENRQFAEREKDSRRAVLLDSAPAKAHSRSSSLNRPTARTLTPLSGPASAPASRTASPASTVRQLSRLTAVPPKPPTSSTFRIGKGVVPSSIALSRAASSSSSSSTGGGAASPPRVAPARAAADAPISRSTTRQDSAASSASSSSSAASLLQKTSGASVTSPESLPTAVDGVQAQGAEEKRAPTAESKPSAPQGPVRAGGGLMKGKETLKKEKRREERAKERGSVPPKRPSTGTSTNADDADDMDAPGEPDVDGQEVSRPTALKRRRVEQDERDVAGANRREASSSRGGVSAPAAKPAVKTTIVTKVVTVKRGASERGSGSEASRGKSSKDTDQRRARDRREQSADAGSSPPPVSKKKKGPPAKAERWYSSSSEDEGGTRSQPARRPATAKRTSNPVKSAPSTGSPLRNSTSAAALRTPPIPAPPAPLPPVPIASAAEFASSRVAFFEAYAKYAVAHARATEERHRLERGEAASLGAAEARQLVQDVLKQQAELEALRDGMKIFVEGVKT